MTELTRADLRSSVAELSMRSFSIFSRGRFIFCMFCFFFTLARNGPPKWSLEVVSELEKWSPEMVPEIRDEFARKCSLDCAPFGAGKNRVPEICDYLARDVCMFSTSCGHLERRFGYILETTAGIILGQGTIMETVV